MRRALAAILLVATGWAGATLTHGHTTPRCPTEDSCTVDYDHGRWTVTEVTP